MAESSTWKDRLVNRFFAIPEVAQAWARITAGGTRAAINTEKGIPFTLLSRPISQCTFSLITTGGVHLRSQTPFDMDSPDGDASYREIRLSAPHEEITITHKYYDHRDADRDLNVIFPLDQFRDLVTLGVIGRLGARHFGFMGHIEGEELGGLTRESAPHVADALKSDGVDCVFLTPA